MDSLATGLAGIIILTVPLLLWLRFKARARYERDLAEVKVLAAERSQLLTRLHSRLDDLASLGGPDDLYVQYPVCHRRGGIRNPLALKMYCPECTMERLVSLRRPDDLYGECPVCHRRVEIIESPAESQERLIEGADTGMWRVSRELWAGIERFWKERAEKASSARRELAQPEEEAKRLFREIFGVLRPEESTSFGRQYFGAKVHPDNFAAGLALEKTGIQLRGDDLARPEVSSEIRMETKDNIVLIGGPTSTPLTRVAFEMEGESNRELRLRPGRILSLPYYLEADETQIEDYRVGWQLESVGPVSTVNWAFVYTDPITKDQRPLRPEHGLGTVTVRQGDTSETVTVPADNYLLVTRLPNFLSPNFGTLLQAKRAPHTWPHLTVFSGNHGLGTRGLELLMRAESLELLNELKERLGGATEFQVVFRVGDIELTKEGFHKPHTIELLNVPHAPAVVPLDFKCETYQKVHEYAVERLRRSVARVRLNAA